MNPKMYRPQALASIDVGERLDTAVRVVNPASLLVVVAASVLIVTAVVWSFVGRVPSRVYGEGLLLRKGQITDVTSMADGQVQRVCVAVGDIVQENDVLAYVDQPELTTQHAIVEAKLRELSGEYASLKQLDEQGRDLKHSVFAQRRVAASYSLRETKKQLAFYEAKLAADTRLLEEGLATPATVAETRQRVLDLNDAINTRRVDAHDIDFGVLDATRGLESRKFELSLRVSDARRELEEIDKRIETRSKVVAKSSGRVIEVKVTDGDAVTRGKPIATLEVFAASGSELIATVYVPAQEGKRVKAEMPIKLAPATIKPEEDGYLDGVVDSVSPFPISEQSMVRAVRNDNLVSSLLKGGPVYEVRVRVSTDPATPSGLHWSNGRGPTSAVASGTPVHGLVAVRTRRPIELVVPAMKRLVTEGASSQGDDS